MGLGARPAAKAVSRRDDLPIDQRAHAPMPAERRLTAPKPTARALDALIAAVAVANGLPLYTCNPAVLSGIDDLVVRTVPVPGERR